MNVLVTGANGQLGTHMRIVSAGSADRYIFTDVSDLPGVETVYLDITDAAAVNDMVETCGIGAVVNCAAYTDVDRAEDDRAAADILNRQAVKNLAEAMKAADGLLVHISTDYVFGKEPYNVPCREDRQGTPTGVYGRTKLAGEREVLLSGCNYLIIRTAWLYSEYGKNFVKTMLRLTGTKSEVKVVFDQTGTPTYARDLAETIFNIMETRKYEVRFRESHSGVFGAHRLPHTSVPQQRISLESHPSRLFRVGQDEDQGDVRPRNPVLDGFSQTLSGQYFPG